MKIIDNLLWTPPIALLKKLNRIALEKLFTYYDSNNKQYDTNDISDHYTTLFTMLRKLNESKIKY